MKLTDEQITDIEKRAWDEIEADCVNHTCAECTDTSCTRLLRLVSEFRTARKELAEARGVIEEITEGYHMVEAGNDFTWGDLGIILKRWEVPDAGHKTEE